MRARMRFSRAWLGPVIAASVALAVVGAGAVASLESGTVGSFWEGLWWAVSLMTTVGFIGAPPASLGGALVSVVLMLSGFVLLALVSASFAALFVREDTEPFEALERRADLEILRRLDALGARLAALESGLAVTPETGPQVAQPTADREPED